MNYVPSPELLQATAESLQKELQEYNQQNLALTLWAYAKLGYKVTLYHLNVELFLDLATKVLAKRSKGTEAFAGQVPTEVLDAAAEHAANTLAESNPQNLANILWAFATMGRIPCAKLLSKAAERFIQLLPIYNQQGIANTLWAFATLGHYPGTAAHKSKKPRFGLNLSRDFI